ncbi:MAG: Holliday junction branch migration protein RuvA [Chloroflexi bacterium]|nr:Holliday junction branch migration protein RuvA [Chloroflexota bacterium]
MIASIEGVVTSIAPDSAVLKVGGVGYRVWCGPNTLAALTIGQTAELHTHHLVREDQQALYGFRTPEELACFELLTTVSGVGPKVGLAIVSSRPVTDLQLAILQGDEAVLTAVSGVGKRLAGRIVLELREKVAAGGAIGAAAGPTGGASGADVVGALQALGYTPAEAREAARSAVAALPANATLEDRVKAALGLLRQG